MFIKKLKEFLKVKLTTNKYDTKGIALSVFIVLTVRWGLAEAYRIPTESMNPTLKPGDMIFVNKAQYGMRVPFTKTWLFETGPVQRGDVVVFRYPKDESTYYVKRVIGLPGDQVFINSDGHVFINGVQQRESYLAQRNEHAFPALVPYGPLTIPNEQYFVLGDNRDNSSDSRIWGFVPRSHLMGKVSFKWFSWVD